MTAQVGDDLQGDDHQGEDAADNRWSRLAGAERLVSGILAANGVPTLYRQHVQRAGRPALGGHIVELAVFAAARQVERLELLQATEAAAERAEKPAAATVRLVSGVPVVSMTLESFAALTRAATPETLRDTPVTEDWPLGTSECSICGKVYPLGRALKPGEDRILTCSQRCRSRARTLRRKDRIFET